LPEPSLLRYISCRTEQDAAVRSRARIDNRKIFNLTSPKLSSGFDLIGYTIQSLKERGGYSFTPISFGRRMGGLFPFFVSRFRGDYFCAAGLCGKNDSLPGSFIPED